MNKLIQYLRDVRTEMSKVAWPARSEVNGATTLVVILSVVVAVFVKLFDWGLNFVIGKIINL